MEAVLKTDPTVAEWPTWSVSKTAQMVIDGHGVQEIFAMIHRQIEVLRHSTRSQDGHIKSLIKRDEDNREKLDRETSRLHDRVDRMMKQLEGQNRNETSSDEKIVVLEQKIKSLEESINEIKISVEKIGEKSNAVVQQTLPSQLLYQQFPNAENLIMSANSQAIRPYSASSFGMQILHSSETS